MSRAEPHPTSEEKAMVPSTGDRLGWHRQQSSEAPRSWYPQDTRNPRGPVGCDTCHAGRAQRPLSPLPGVCQRQSPLHSAEHCPKRPQDPPAHLPGALACLVCPWLWHLPGAPWCQPLHQIQSHFLTPSPPKYATYIHPGRRAPGSRGRTEAREPVGHLGLLGCAGSPTWLPLSPCSWKSALQACAGSGAGLRPYSAQGWVLGRLSLPGG